MNEVLQYGALGILGVLILFLVPFLVRWLVNHIDAQAGKMNEMGREFRRTIDNHMDHETEAINKLTEAIDHLCSMWNVKP